jgi:LysM repeat protein
MRISIQKLASLTLLSILFPVLAACAITPTALVPTFTPLAYLTPYLSPTPSQTPPPPMPSVTFTVMPSITPTPFLHVLAKDDTLLGLAFRYGVSLEDILAANPGINPHFLTVGKAIVIPLKVDEPTALPSPTLFPIKLGTPHCYPAGDGGVWCALLLQNNQDQAVENVSARLGLYSAKGKNIASQVVAPPLNLVEKGQAQPLMAYFDLPLDSGVIVRAELLSAFTVLNRAKRYLPFSIQDEDVRIDPSGKLAEVQGQVVLTGTVKASALWVVAVAYAENGEVAGMRKWEAESDPSCLAPLPSDTPAPGGTVVATASPAAARRLPRRCQTFDLTVFSLGPVIQRVEVLAEARP